MKDKAKTFPSWLLWLCPIWVVGSHREGGSLASLFTSRSPLSLSHCKSTAAAGASSVGDTISFILKANSGLGLKCRGFGLVGFFRKNTHISAYILKQKLDLTVGGINHCKACPLLLNSKAAKLKLVKVFFKKDAQKLRLWLFLRCLALMLAVILHFQICAAVLLFLQPNQESGSFLL